MNEISTTLYKINWKFLIDNALKKAFWKNTWKIFEVDGHSFNMSISSIDVVNNKLNLVMRNPSYTWNYEYLSIPMDKAHFNEEVFGRSVYSTIKAMLRYAESKLIFDLDVYKNAVALDDVTNEARKELLRDEKMDKLGFSLPLDADQEEVLDTWVFDKFSYKYPNKEGVHAKLIEKYKSEWYGLLALTLGKESDYITWNDISLSTCIDDLLIELRDKYPEVEVDEEEESD